MNVIQLCKITAFDNIKMQKIQHDTNKQWYVDVIWSMNQWKLILSHGQRSWSPIPGGNGREVDYSLHTDYGQFRIT